MTIRSGKACGYTLTELLISISIVGIIMTAVYAMFLYSSNSHKYASTTYQLTRESYSAIEKLKRDLTQTSLSTVRAYPCKDWPDEQPGLSFESAFDSKKEKFEITSYGTPLWKKHIFYTLIPSGSYRVGQKDYLVGNLTRWNLDLEKKSLIPVPAELLPSDLKMNKPQAGKKVVMRDLLMPGQDIFPSIIDDKYGGFRVSFIRQDPAEGKRYLTPENPCTVCDDGIISGTSHNTELIQLDILILRKESDKGKPDGIYLNFQIEPAN